MLTDYYTYIYLDPRKPGNYTYDFLKFDFEPFYAGKGRSTRDMSHLRNSCKSYDNKIMQNKIKRIIAETKVPIILHLKEQLTEQEAWDYEILVIKKIGRICDGTGPLANFKDGGTGGSLSDDIKKRISDTKRRNKKVMSKEEKQKRSDNMKKRWQNNREELLNQICKATRTNECRKLHSQRTKERCQTPEAVQKRIDKTKQAYERKRKAGMKWMWVNNGIKQGRYDEQNALKLLEQGWVRGRLPFKGKPRSEEAKQHMREANALPENRARRIANSKKRWGSKDYRQKRLDSYKRTVEARNKEKS